MKKICRKLKLMKYGCVFDQETLDKLSGENFVICFFDGTYKSGCSKSDLVKALEQDYIKNIRYIFDMVNRIIIDRTVVIDMEGI